MKRFILLLAVVCFGILCFQGYGYASGFLLYHQDTKAQGQAGAFTAQADNPSAVYYNPAGMNQVHGTQISAGARVFNLNTKYENTQGDKENLKAKWEAVPSLFITSDFKTEKWTFGLGVFPPFGLSTSWSGNGLLRYVATDTSLKMVDINPSVAYQIVPQLSVGAGVDYYNIYSYISESKQNYLIGDANNKLDVSGDGWGFNLGGLWKPHPKHSFGLTYRSRVKTKLSGDLKVEDIPAGLGLPSVVSYNAKTDSTLPSIVSGGYAFRPTDKLKLEGDIYWVEWSTIDKAEVTDKDTDALLSYTNKDWKDTWIFALGGEYLLTQNWAVRTGYSYQQNAVPEETFNPNVPDSNLHVIAVGLGFTKDRITIDLAYAIGLYTKRDIDTGISMVLPNPDGKYDSFVHIIGATVGFKF